MFHVPSPARGDPSFAILLSALLFCAHLSASGAGSDTAASPPERSHELTGTVVAEQTGAPVADAVAPGHRRLGVMLPATPLHHLLCDALAPHGIDTLVMTSGNLSDEPICTDEREAVDRLGSIADGLLVHDRPIARHADAALPEEPPAPGILGQGRDRHQPRTTRLERLQVLGVVEAERLVAEDTDPHRRPRGRSGRAPSLHGGRAAGAVHLGLGRRRLRRGLPLQSS